MERVEESICCQEVDAVRNKILADIMEERLQAEPRCIVQHPGFEAVCLNIWVVQTAWLQYKQQYGSSAYEGPEHKKNHHISYRQLVRSLCLLVLRTAYMPTSQSPTRWRRTWFLLVLLMQMSKL